MNNIEEKLWDYIDGNCTETEQNAIAGLIASDEAYRQKYQELMRLNSEFSAIELDEPPMAFTYNVMEQIRAEHAQQPLKSTINKRIIIGITAFFALTIVGLLGYILVSINWSAGGGNTESMPVNFKLPNLSKYITTPVLEGGLFFYVILALFLFDTYLRKKNVSKHVQ